MARNFKVLSPEEKAEEVQASIVKATGGPSPGQAKPQPEDPMSRWNSPKEPQDSGLPIPSKAPNPEQDVTARMISNIKGRINPETGMPFYPGSEPTEVPLDPVMQDKIALQK